MASEKDVIKYINGETDSLIDKYIGENIHQEKIFMNIPIFKFVKIVKADKDVLVEEKTYQKIYQLTFEQNQDLYQIKKVWI